MGRAPNSEQEYLAPGAKTLVGAVKQQYSWNVILDLFYTILHSTVIIHCLKNILYKCAFIAPPFFFFFFRNDNNRTFCYKKKAVGLIFHSRESVR